MKPDPDLVSMLNSLYMPLYQICALTWAMVLYQYGRATLFSFRARHGGTLPLFQAFKQHALGYLRSQYRAVLGEPHKAVVTPLADGGYYLRLFVTMSSLNLVIAASSTQLIDRRDWPLAVHFMVLGANSISLLAGQGHLLMAWHNQSKRWYSMHRILFFWFIAVFVISFNYWKGIPL